MSTSTTFGLFTKQDDGLGYRLLHVIDSPYETESVSDTEMTRRIDRFDFSNLPFDFSDRLVDSGMAYLLTFNEDNTIGLSPDITDIEITNEDDEANGRRQVKVCSPYVEPTYSLGSNFGVYFRNLYPEGYSTSSSDSSY